MPTNSLVAHQNPVRWLITGLMLLLLIVTYWFYQQGFSAGFQFDDAGSISGVSLVHDVSSALAYLFDGRAGFLGRPLVLATFLLQKESWPNDSGAFFLVNTLIHLFNGILVYWLSYQLGRFFPGKVSQPAWFALAVTALWLTLPLHVSASLMAVQRMATLSSTFMLLGLIGYVSGRRVLDKSPVRAYWSMSLSLVVGTALALLCKESGALLPVYVLVLEATLIRVTGTPTDLWFKRWAWVFLGTPVLLMVAYFVHSWPTLMNGYGLRTFSLSERLLTEPRILWDYLRQIYLPTRAGTGPYQDDYLISRGWFDPAITSVSIFAWVIVVAGAVWLRKRSPVILFGVLWFLAGHLIESTFLPLELYFEHRNYLASLGPLLAAVALILGVPAKIWRAALVGLLLMVALRLFALNEATSLWGQPMASARVWAEEHPQSIRAIVALAGGYSDAGDRETARQVILNGHTRMPNDATLALQAVYLSCSYDDEARFLARAKKIEPVLSSGPLTKIGSALLRAMYKSRQDGNCPYLTNEQLFRFIDLVLINPQIRGMSGSVLDLYILKSKLYAQEGRADLAIQELEAAFNYRAEYQIAISVATAMTNSGRAQEAIDFLDRAMSFAPQNPALKDKWEMEFQSVKQSIRHKLAASESTKDLP